MSLAGSILRSLRLTGTLQNMKSLFSILLFSGPAKLEYRVMSSRILIIIRSHLYLRSGLTAPQVNRSQITLLQDEQSRCLALIPGDHSTSFALNAKRPSQRPHRAPRERCQRLQDRGEGSTATHWRYRAPSGIQVHLGLVTAMHCCPTYFSGCAVTAYLPLSSACTGPQRRACRLLLSLNPLGLG